MNSRLSRLLQLAAAAVAAILARPSAPAQTAAASAAVNPDTDRSRMLNLLHLPTPPKPRKNRNHDEAKATLFPTLPDPLVLTDGQPVASAEMWWQRRRPEVYAAVMTEIYGQIPALTPKINWEVTAQTNDGKVKTKTIVGHIDNSRYPAAAPTIQMTLSLPANAAGPVPVIVQDGPAPGSFRNLRPPGGANPAAPAAPVGPSGRDQVLAQGWGFATFNTGSVQADNAAGLTSGIIGLINQGQPRQRTDEWGVLSAWAWGLSQAADYFETDPDVDAKQLGLEGFSRWGKTAVLAAAIEKRWIVTWAGNSGAGGVKLNRRDYGESLDDVAEENESYWMAGNFLKYAGHHWNDLPVDSHELVALVAPRAVFITGGTADQNSDAKGMFLAAVGAGPVYRLLGKQDLGATEMPPPDVALIAGDLGFREHTGGHIQAPDWPAFIAFAGKYLHAPAPK
jgi:hypothetical protein